MTDDPRAPTTSQADFLKTALARIRSNLELFLGRPLVLAAAEPVAASGAELAERLPSRSVVLGTRVSGTVDAEIHCVASQTLLLAIAGHARHQADAQIGERLAGPSEMTDPERAGIEEVASFITAALGDFARESTGGRIVLAPREARFSVRGDPPPWSAEESGFALEATIQVGGAPPSLLVLFVPAAVVTAWAASERRAVPAAAVERARPAPPVEGARVAAWVAGGEAFVSSVQAAAAGVLAVRAVPSIAGVVAAAAASPGPAVLVVEVAAGSEYELDLVGALRRHPALAATRVIVALGVPTRATVLRCGELGLLDVVPAALDAPALAERLLSAARGKRAAAKPR